MTFSSSYPYHSLRKGNEKREKGKSKDVEKGRSERDEERGDVINLAVVLNAELNLAV